MLPILLVHGAWHNGAGYSRLISSLASRGITATTVELSSAAASDKPIGDMYQDAQLVSSAVDSIGSDCYVLAHSYGGLPVTEGLAGKKNVRGIIYLTAFVLDVGETLFAACGSVDPVWWQRNADNTRLTANNPLNIFYNTTDPATGEEVAASLRTQSISSFTQPITKTAWKEIDSTYIICEKDNAIPVFAQEAMSQRCKRVMRMDTDHSPFLCAPEELAELIMRLQLNRD